MLMQRPYKICTRCIMDTSDPDIDFDSNGVCNHCHRYQQLLSVRSLQGAAGEEKVRTLTEKIKAAGKNNEYDCIIGVSGGVDSTYVAYIVKKLGLRPLAIHFDNGWNSELSVSNIEKVLKKLDIDLHTYVIDWEEFRELQVSFLKASTPDGEVPTDHAINALLFREASQRGIKYIINGMNFATESLSVPAWAYGHSDWKYIRSVHKIFSGKKLKHYPYYNFFNLLVWTFLKRIQVVSILNYLPYKRDEVMNVLQNELGWKYYGGKHYESIYTRFYQSYVLPKKFGFDKKRGHLSDLINSGQLSREQALVEMNHVNYSPEMAEEDKTLVIKKLRLSEQQFQNIMTTKPKTFHEYPNNQKWVMQLKKFVNYLRSKGLYSR